MPKITWTDFNNGEGAGSVRAKLNQLGNDTKTFSSAVVDNLNVKTLIFTNQTVLTSAWVNDSTYVNFPFKATITCPNVTVNDTPFVMFAAKEQESGNFTGADTGANAVYIYAAAKPSATITIPNIVVLQGVNLNV